METKLATSDEMDEVFKTFQRSGIQMIPASHADHQMAIAIGTPEKHKKYLITFETFE